MIDLGDRFAGCTLFGQFTTVNTCGIPVVLTGAPGDKSAGNCFVVVWDTTGAMTCSTAGVSEAFTCKGVSGWNAFSVNTEASKTFYGCGHDYLVTLHGGRVEGTCVSYYPLATFSLSNRAALRPVVAGRRFDECSTVFRVETLSNTATSSILDAPLTQPTGVFAWATATLRNVLAWVGALSSNCIQQTVTTQTLRLRDNSGAVAAADLTCTATAVHRGSFA